MKGPPISRDTVKRTYLSKQGEKRKRQVVLGKKLRTKNLVLSKLKFKDTTFILDHPLYPVSKLLQLHYSPAFEQDDDMGIPESWAKINHQIDIGVSIRSIFPILRKWGNTQNELSFDCLRFHLHHIGKEAVSKLMRFHPDHNLHHRSDLIEGRMIKNRRGINLKINHQIRIHNLNIYRQMLQKQPIFLVAESSYGAIIGFAQIDFYSFLKRDCATSQTICLQFKQKLKHLQNLQQATTLFRAKAELSLQISPICPELQQLSQLPNQKVRNDANSRSVSPKRVSKSPGKRPGSSKSKNKVLKGVWMEDAVVKLSVFEGRQYKCQVVSVNPTVSKQLVYKKVMNIEKRKVQLVKIGGNYYFKMLLIRQSPTKPGSLHFSFNNVEYRVYVISNTLLQIFELADFQNNLSKRKAGSQPILHLGHGEHVFAKDTSRIVKNVTRQQVYDGLLGTVHLKSALSGCQIYCNKPFIIYQIVHKEDGYLITYYYRQDIVRQTVETTLVFYIHQGGKATEIHAFDCLIKPRRFDRETLSRQLHVPKDQIFLKLSMKLITHQNYQYQIYSTDEESLAVINGQNFKYQQISNQWLEIQILKQPLDIISTDLVFYDSRAKSFFVRLILHPLPSTTPS